VPIPAEALLEDERVVTNNKPLLADRRGFFIGNRQKIRSISNVRKFSIGA